MTVTDLYFEERNRRSQAKRIAAWIAERLTLADVVEPGRSTFLGGMRESHQSIRDAVAKEAGAKSPSAETWALVTEMVRERMAWMARGASRSRSA